jgi:hypothetical protein
MSNRACACALIGRIEAAATRSLCGCVLQEIARMADKLDVRALHVRTMCRRNSIATMGTGTEARSSPAVVTRGDASAGSWHSIRSPEVKVSFSQLNSMSAVNAQARLSQSSDALTQAMQRISSGLRINSGVDGPTRLSQTPPNQFLVRRRRVGDDLE